MEANQVLEDVKQYIVVNFDHEQYGIDIKYVQNIVRMMKITRVPKAPYYIKGVINLRGEIIPVMSVRLKFNLAEDKYANGTRIIIVKVEGNAIGLVVDEVREVIQLTSNDIDKIVREASDEKSKYIFGVGKLGQDLVTLLNVEGLISPTDSAKN